MAERKPEWPEASDLIVRNIKFLTGFDAYALEGKNNWFGNFENA